MIDFSFPDPVILLLPAAVIDGNVRFREIAARALILPEEEFQPGNPSVIQNRTELLLQASVPPVSGGRIRLRGKEFQLGSIRTCKDMGGNMVCYRCRVLN